MPSRRMIHPAFWQSYTMAQLTPGQRLLFIGLISNADDQGRLKGHPALIRSIVFPFDDISVEAIDADLAAIAATGSLILYQVDGQVYIQIVGWWDYQAPQWAYPSTIPAPEGWTDRLRYRKNKQVHLVNWNGYGGFKTRPPDLGKTEGADSPDASGNDLPNDLPNDIVEYRDSDSLGVDNNGASAPSPSPLLPDTDASRLLFGRLQANAKAKGRRGPKQFQSIECKEKFDKAALRLGPEQTEAAIIRAMQKSLTSATKATDFIAKWQGDGYKPPAKSKGGASTRLDGTIAAGQRILKEEGEWQP